ncbi:hypothetical protein HHI36_010793, partial [Cryptolaemus montrouzieri]
MALGDSPTQQPGLEDEFGSDDEDVLLSELVSTSESHVSTSSASTSSNRTVVAKPKWKKNFRMEEPNQKKTCVVIRRERNGDGTDVARPEAVIQYKRCMNYVDEFDQLK